MAFSPDGASLLTAHETGSALFWDVASRKPVGPPAVLLGPIRAVTFTPDGKACACVAADSTVRRWPVPAPLAEPDLPRLADRVALLTGCIQDLVFANVNRDTADVLLANGCAVDTPPLQPCCGSLHAHNGELELAREQARRMLDLFPPDRYDAIITNAGGCGSHLRHYGQLLHSDSRYGDAARVWDRKVKDVQEWLVESFRAVAPKKVAAQLIA